MSALLEALKYRHGPNQGGTKMMGDHDTIGKFGIPPVQWRTNYVARISANDELALVESWSRSSIRPRNHAGHKKHASFMLVGPV